MTQFIEILNTWKETHSPESAIGLIGLIPEAIECYRNEDICKSALTDYLKESSKQEYISALGNYENRNKWAEASFLVIRETGYNLRELFRHRAEEIAGKTLFRDMSKNPPGNWTYRRIDILTQEYAAAFFSLDSQPRVAIFADNSVESACCDLACLFYDIVDTPLATTIKEEHLIDIFNKLSINIVITDSMERAELLQKIKNDNRLNYHIVSIRNHNKWDCLHELTEKNNNEAVHRILGLRRRLALNEVATVMFTSGSTGIPKGISFTNYHLVTKRFARAAALPDVGKDETLLCYLPLYHTFGRYLEMLGMIFWRGTYVFTGNVSHETLINLFPRIKPTGFISVPVRWVQLGEDISDKMEEAASKEEKKLIFDRITGGNLRWGLSAAGFMDPKVFNFFRRNDVFINSGFGMTEATGGITMTPPDNYVENSVGMPLPGIKVRLNEQSELVITGHYAAQYFDKAVPGEIINYPDSEGNAHDIATGDIFRCDEFGFYYIVDRVKDIYKNNKGQTIAPKNVEMKFEGVPGIKNVFLVGDGKPYNTLLIAPDFDDEIIMHKDGSIKREYFRKIISQANKQLPTFERVINFIELDRNFMEELGELTPKGSFNRKNIEFNFRDVIEKLYRRNYSEFVVDNIKIRIPRWFFRDLGILESELDLIDDKIINNSDENSIILKLLSDNKIQIGNLVYKFDGDMIDLGIIARQPALWIANPEFIRFAPIKDGFDTSPKNIHLHAELPDDSIQIQPENIPSLDKFNAFKLDEANKLLTLALFGYKDDALASLKLTEKLILISQDNLAAIIRHRLETCAYHNDINIRAEAYKILLLDEPSPDYDEAFPAFLLSGKAYLTAASIHEIADGILEKRRLESFRKRMNHYRNHVELPKTEKMLRQFENIFKLLIEFTELNPKYYTSVRYEFVSWILYDKNPEISELAEIYFNKLHDSYENNLEKNKVKIDKETRNSLIIYDDDIHIQERKRLDDLLLNTAFLTQSLMLVYDEFSAGLDHISANGIWINRLDGTGDISRYRISVNLKNKSFYELQIFTKQTEITSDEIETIYRHLQIGGNSFGIKILPKLGAYRPEHRAWSMEYFGELSVWDKIREYSNQRVSGFSGMNPASLRKLYIESLIAIFRAFDVSGRRIVPGYMLPKNAFVPELDFRDGAIINGVEGWKYCNSPVQIVEPLIRNFYEKAIFHYVWLEPYLQIEWIFDSIIEAFGQESGMKYLRALLSEIENLPIHYRNADFSVILGHYLINTAEEYNPPLPIKNAIERYFEWFKLNTEASSAARRESVEELIGLYNLERFGETGRFYLYRNTYFIDLDLKTAEKFGDLIRKLYKSNASNAVEFIELSELQGMIKSNEDREVFIKMVYPQKMPGIRVELRKSAEIIKHVIIKSYIKDKYGEIYSFAEASEASEIGALYRLFFKEKFPKQILSDEEYFILIDSEERVVGGICWRKTDSETVFIEGSVVQSSLKGRGLGSSMIEDFASRMAAQGINQLKTHFYLKEFYLKRGFELSARRGALVRSLTLNSHKQILGSYCLI